MPDTSSPPVVTGVSPEERLAIERFYRAFSGDVALLDEAVTADWLDIPLAAGQAPGREAMKPMIRGFVAAFPDARVTIHEIVGAPGRAGVRAQIDATHAGEWLGVPPSRRRFTMALHEFHHLEEGRLTHTWHLEDWFGWLTQVGGWPARPSTTQQEDAA